MINSPVLSVGPVMVVAAWLLAGQWAIATPHQRAWLQLTTAMLLVMLVPVPGGTRYSFERLTLLRIWGWTTVAGLMLMV